MDKPLPPDVFADIMSKIVDEAFTSENIIGGYEEGLRIIFNVMWGNGYDLTDFLRLKEWNGADG